MRSEYADIKGSLDGRHRETGAGYGFQEEKQNRLLFNGGTTARDAVRNDSHPESKESLALLIPAAFGRRSSTHGRLLVSGIIRSQDTATDRGLNPQLHGGLIWPSLPSFARRCNTSEAEGEASSS